MPISVGTVAVERKRLEGCPVGAVLGPLDVGEEEEMGLACALLFRGDTRAPWLDTEREIGKHAGPNSQPSERGT